MVRHDFSTDSNTLLASAIIATKQSTYIPRPPYDLLNQTAIDLVV